MRAPISDTVKLRPAGAEVGVCGPPREELEELDENDADLVMTLSFPFTEEGIAGLGGMSAKAFGSCKEMFDDEKYIENALLDTEAREARFGVAASLALRSWSLSRLQ